MTQRMPNQTFKENPLYDPKLYKAVRVRIEEEIQYVLSQIDTLNHLIESELEPMLGCIHFFEYKEYAVGGQIPSLNVKCKTCGFSYY